MKTSEVRIIKRELANYKDLIKLARDKEEEANLLHEKLLEVGGAKAISYGESVPKSSPSDLQSKMNTIIALSQEAEAKAKEYRLKAQAIKEFIAGIDDERKAILSSAYIDGKKFQDIAEEMNYSLSSINMAIFRCLKAVPLDAAREAGLII